MYKSYQNGEGKYTVRKRLYLEVKSVQKTFPRFDHEMNNEEKAPNENNDSKSKHIV